MLSIALSEFRMLVRNKLVAASAIFIPIAFGAFFLFTGSPNGVATVAVLQIMVMALMGVYVTTTTTLAARRQTLFLKRLRSGAVSDSSIIAGLVLPIVIVSVVQVGIVLAVLAATATQPPAHAWLLAIAVIAAEIMLTGFALATAGITNSPEHAQVTTLPLFFVVLGISFWVVFTGTEDFTWVKRALPGGGLTELILTAWDGGDLGNLAVLTLPSLAWAAIALYAARAMFRWEPRV
ncbi:MAG: ABC transporter permease [Microbacteriaceae bacterium]